MNTYFVDTLGVKTRDWLKIDDNLVAATLCKTPNEIRCSDAVVMDGAVLVHRSALGPDFDLEYLKQVCSPTLSIIVVRGSTQVEGELVRGQLYCRWAPVDIPIDPVFSSCWKAFLDQRQAGQTDFTLLEPICVNTVLALKLLAELVSAQVSSGYMVDRQSDLGWWLQGIATGSANEMQVQLSNQLTREVGLTTAGRIVNALNATCADLQSNIKRFAEFISDINEEYRDGRRPNRNG
jgi:hypothetical protein